MTRGWREIKRKREREEVAEVRYAVIENLTDRNRIGCNLNKTFVSIAERVCLCMRCRCESQPVYGCMSTTLQAELLTDCDLFLL